MHGTEYALWSTDTEILAGTFDRLAIANWQRAGKGPRPKPLTRPKDKAAKRTAFGTPMDLDDLDALIGWKSPRSRE